MAAVLLNATVAVSVSILSGCWDPDHAANAALDGRTVLFGTTSRIRGFDPAKAGDVESALAIGNIYEGLLQYSYLKRPYQVEPCLAAALPEVSINGLDYTFKIREGIFFQDDPCFIKTGGKGRELVAEDFVYAIKRVAHMDTASTGYWVFDGRIAGLDEFRKKSGEAGGVSYDTPVDGLTAVDKTTFKVRLKEPYPQFLWILTMQYAFAVPREAVEYYGQDFVNHPVGTGPYRLKSWQRNYRVEYERSPKWAETGRVETYPDQPGETSDEAEGLMKDAGKPLPLADGLVDYVMEDQTTQWLKFVNGDLESSGVSRDNWNAVIMGDGALDPSLRKTGIKLFTRPTLDVYYLGFNMDDPVVGKNKKLRQALSCCFNSDEWVKFWNGRIVRATGPIPPNVAGHEEKRALYPFDLEKARALLVEAGYPGGCDPVTGKSLQLSVELGNANPQTRDAVELVASFIKQVGVIVNPSYNNWPSFLQKMERRQCQLYWLGWVADYPDAENFLQLFVGRNSSPGPNHSNYVNPEFDKLYDQIRTMADGPERTLVYQTMSHIIEEDCPWIFMHHPVAYGLHHAWLRNYKPHDFPYGMGKYRTVDLDVQRETRKLLRSAAADR
jgi:oligopeptide transport system substrate-binding protein